MIQRDLEVNYLCVFAYNFLQTIGSFVYLCRDSIDYVDLYVVGAKTILCVFLVAGLLTAFSESTECPESSISSPEESGGGFSPMYECSASNCLLPPLLFLKCFLPFLKVSDQISGQLSVVLYCVYYKPSSVTFK